MSTGKLGRLAGVAAGLALVGVFAAAVGHAQQAGRGDGQLRQRAGRPGAMMRQGPMGLVRLGLAQLGLTDQQKEQVKTIMSGHRAELQALAERAAPAHRGLADAISAGDEAAIRQKSADLAAVQTDRALLAGRIRGEILKVLTPEQQQKAQSMRERLQRRLDERRGGRRNEGRTWN